jgi:hypothetical protein
MATLILIINAVTNRKSKEADVVCLFSGAVNYCESTEWMIDE